MLRWLPVQVGLSVLLIATCASPVSQHSDVLLLEVAAHTVECTGEARQRCLVVRTGPDEQWTYFYDRIAGFTYQEGYEYRIEVARERVSRPPADASAFTYRLLRIVSKVPAQT